MARAMRAPGLWNPNAILVMTRQSMYSLPIESQTSAPAAFVMTRPGSLPVDHPLRSARRDVFRTVPPLPQRLVRRCCWALPK